jgi:hypothetical protein
MILIQDQRRLNLLIWVIVVSIRFFGFAAGSSALLTGGQFCWDLRPASSPLTTRLAVALIMVAPLVRYPASCDQPLDTARPAGKPCS